jgi:hypothetical protein
MKEKEINKLVDEIIKYLPKFFDDFKNWEYGTGSNAGRDFKRMYNRAKKIRYENVKM